MDSHQWLVAKHSQAFLSSSAHTLGTTPTSPNQAMWPEVTAPRLYRFRHLPASELHHYQSLIRRPAILGDCTQAYPICKGYNIGQLAAGSGVAGYWAHEPKAWSKARPPQVFPILVSYLPVCPNEVHLWVAERGGHTLHKMIYLVGGGWSDGTRTTSITTIINLIIRAYQSERPTTTPSR